MLLQETFLRSLFRLRSFLLTLRIPKYQVRVPRHFCLCRISTVSISGDISSLGLCSNLEEARFDGCRDIHGKFDFKTSPMHIIAFYEPGTLPPKIVKLLSDSKASVGHCNGPFQIPDFSTINNLVKLDLHSLGKSLHGKERVTTCSTQCPG